MEVEVGSFSRTYFLGDFMLPAYYNYGTEENKM
jgi:hypothetical protein